MIFMIFCVFLFGAISGAFLCVPACFSGAVFPCFLSCFFWCLLVILLVVFFVLFPLYSGAFFRAFFRACPFSFLYIFPLGGGPVFCRAFFGGFWVLFSVLFSVLFFVFFFCVFFVPFIVHFFVHFFVRSRAYFRAFFFVPWAAPKTSNHNILHFGPCVFWCFFWWSLLVKIGNTQYIGRGWSPTKLYRDYIKPILRIIIKTTRIQRKVRGSFSWLMWIWTDLFMSFFVWGLLTWRIIPGLDPAFVKMPDFAHAIFFWHTKR